MTPSGENEIVNACRITFSVLRYFSRDLSCFTGDSFFTQWGKKVLNSGRHD